MFLTRRHTRSVLRAVLPLLALVWASLPLHHCNLAGAGGAETRPAATMMTGTDAHAAHCHQVPAGQPAESSMSCDDLGRAGPDLRPSLTIDVVQVQLSFDARGHDPGLHPVSRRDERPQDDGRWHPRRLHLQKSVLLV